MRFIKVETVEGTRAINVDCVARVYEDLGQLVIEYLHGAHDRIRGMSIDDWVKESNNDELCNSIQYASDSLTMQMKNLL